MKAPKIIAEIDKNFVCEITVKKSVVFTNYFQLFFPVLAGKTIANRELFVYNGAKRLFRYKKCEDRSKA